MDEHSSESKFFNYKILCKNIYPSVPFCPQVTIVTIIDGLMVEERGDHLR